MRSPRFEHRQAVSRRTVYCDQEARTSLAIIGGSSDVARHLLKLLPTSQTRSSYLISRRGAIPSDANPLSVTPVSADITDASLTFFLQKCGAVGLSAR